MLHLVLVAACVPPESGTATSAVPAQLDTDGDGLTDREEAELGTDPALADTDGDTYLDSWELNEGTDPLDPQSRIYTGYWPYSPDKPDIDVGFEPPAEKGGRLPSGRLMDQHGELVNVYDYYGHGVPVVITVSSMWCAACGELLRWLQGESTPWSDSIEGEAGKRAVAELPGMVADGRLLWLTLYAEDSRGNEPDLADIQDFAEQHSDGSVPLLIDAGAAYYGWTGVGYIPAMVVLDEQLLAIYADDPDASEAAGTEAALVAAWEAAAG